MKLKVIIACFMMLLGASKNGGAELHFTKGVYGVPSVAGMTSEGRAKLLEELRGADAVFTPANGETIAFFKERGFRVFLSVNAFGGTAPAGQFPDSLAVPADGSAPHGTCPTHAGLRAARLREIADLLARFKMDGIWLDFIRYPGRWEQIGTEPLFPDTCYCPRCLATFSRDTGIALPVALDKPVEAAAWIRKNRSYEWMSWKKGQINSFARDVRALMRDSSVLLGAFIVPWTKGEKNGAVTFMLGQDAFALSGIVDVISPMVYHRMVGQNAAWVGEMTEYFRQQARCPVWPIIQSEDTTPGEFAEAARYAGLGGAAGLLVYSHRGMDEGKREALAAFKPPENLIPADNLAPSDNRELPLLKKCEPGESYRLRCLFQRDTWNELSNTYASVWGERYLLEKHLPRDVMQPLEVKVVCPREGTDNVFRFTNEGQTDRFSLAEPKLVKGMPIPRQASAPNDGFFYPGFFPIGIYGVGIQDLEAVKKLALNTVIVGGEGEGLKRTVAECRRNGLHYVLSSPRDPERLKVYLERLAELPMPADDWGLAFYVEDEPEMRAVPPGLTADVQRLIKSHFPNASTCMATVRPSYAREYERGSDFFMIDNYPFPNMPMSWLGDSMDRAAKEVGTDRLLSVIQAFSDGVYWPSMPGWQQIDNLAFLSIVHGSRGIFFYTWSDIGKTKEGRANLGRVVGRLNGIYPWLLEKNLPVQIGVEMLSEYRVDPKGRPGVQACLERKGNELMLIAVNTLGAPVEARLDLKGAAPTRYAHSTFKPYEAKTFLFN